VPPFMALLRALSRFLSQMSISIVSPGALRRAGCTTMAASSFLATSFAWSAQARSFGAALAEARGVERARGFAPECPSAASDVENGAHGAMIKATTVSVSKFRCPASIFACAGGHRAQWGAREGEQVCAPLRPHEPALVVDFCSFRQKLFRT
jgi:hypothetical protein